MTILISTLLILGALLVSMAAAGVLRFPDFYTRMHAASKASSLGLTFILLAAACYFGDLGAWIKVLATILFIYLTIPLAAHILGRIAYRTGIPKWKGTHVDELARDSDR